MMNSYLSVISSIGDRFLLSAPTLLTDSAAIGHRTRIWKLIIDFDFDTSDHEAELALVRCMRLFCKRLIQFFKTFSPYS